MALQWQRVLLLTKTAADASVTGKLLERAGFASLSCRDVNHLISEINVGVALIIIAKEALSQTSIVVLSASLNAQPKWSSLPIILLVGPNELVRGSDRALKLLEPLRNVTLLERPVRMKTFLSLIKAAVADRVRQYEMEELHRELERSRNELDHFAAIAAHDLKSPLASITQFAELLDEDFRDRLGPEGAEYTDFILSASRRMTTLINGLLAFARSGAHFESKPIDLNEIIKLVIKNLDASIRSTKTHLNVSSALPTILGDGIQMSQLFQNLISNSMKFQRQGVVPEIKITCSELQNKWLVELEDNGIGISAEHSKSVFEVFKRLQTDLPYEGSGIGLSVCKKIVEGHKGEMWLESIPGAGTKFFFSLPKQVHIEIMKPPASSH